MIQNTKPPKVISPTIHATILIIASIFVVVITMACVFKVEVVAKGQGKIVPVSRVQIVQPEFDGKVIAIHVRNGSKVRKGDVLIELDATDADAKLNTIKSEITRLQIERARLEDLSLVGIEDDAIEKLESGFSALTLAVFNEGLDTKHYFYQEQRNLLAAETEDLLSSLERNTARSEVNKKSIKVTQAGIDRVNASLDIQRERLSAARDLFERGVSSRFTFLDVQEIFTTLEKEREIYLRELEEKQSHDISLKADRRSIIATERNRISKRKSEIEARMTILDEELRSAIRRKTATRLISPKDGIVDQLAIYTLGGIIRSGQQALRIVPADENMEINGLFTNADIGFIQVGQQANIDLHAYPSARFGYVKGSVTAVSADSIEVSEGVVAFEVRVSPVEIALRKGDLIFPLRPGMTATIGVTTDNRRIITYFFAPIVETIQSALGER
ncbi:MAG: HlyD family type I secretion periplasmic adaptor subunit [Ectothiorhodospiraceae bacterium AqS1]|nr:HlyD family type I secretion periplasmic adaptor subunit [Ectothiorhodospiraceae bacterium AqS1]MBF2761642.1 HlyD family type I secretion periplasmic adaptor subunit [Ectothiorhodospiraceae bacterium AqS1]